MIEQIRLFPEPPAAVVLVYFRYGRRETEEAGSVDEAVRAANSMNDSGEAYPDHLELANGSRIEYAELWRLMLPDKDR